MILQTLLTTTLITLGLGQLSATWWRLPGISLVGNRWKLGYALGGGLILLGAITLPATLSVILLTPIAGILALLLLLWGGSYLAPPPHPDSLFSPQHPAHGGCRSVQIPDGQDQDLMPGLLLSPPKSSSQPKVGTQAVVIIPGAGDTKTFFKWRLVQALLETDITVLTIDPHGHGDYRHRPLVYPDCLSVVASAVEYLRTQPDIEQVGLIGLSLGGAITIKALAQQPTLPVDRIVIVATPTHLIYTKALYYQEAWRIFYRSPSLFLFKDATLKQIRASWQSGGFSSRHTLTELFSLLQPLDDVSHLKDIPLLLVYSQRDAIAPPLQAQAMLQSTPWATFIESKKASHVMLTLMPSLNSQIADWLQKAAR